MEARQLELCLWFNSKKEIMKNRLLYGNSNAGVGIHIGRHKDLFAFCPNYIWLEFDDGTKGRVLIAKDSWGNSTHFIQESIGQWARMNGLWERKINERSVSCILTFTSCLDRFLISK